MTSKFIVAGTAAVAGLLALVVAGCGKGGEWQFSPDSFESRGVAYYYVPHTDLAVVALPGSPYRQKIVQFWLDEGYLAESTGEARRWDVVTGWVAWQKGVYKGPAKQFWYRADCKTDAMADEWIEWSRTHPQLAARFWPDVIVLLAKGRDYYHLAAELMQGVDKTTDPKRFEEAVAASRLAVKATRKEIADRQRRRKDGVP